MSTAPEPRPVRGPLLTAEVHRRLLEARARAAATLECSLDLGRSTTTVSVTPEHWEWQAQRYPYLEPCKDRTVYYWSGTAFEPVARGLGAIGRRRVVAAGDVEQDDGDARARGERGDAGSHGARADDSDLGDPHAYSEGVMLRVSGLWPRRPLLGSGLSGS